jgi:hypothetical protein
MLEAAKDALLFLGSGITLAFFHTCGYNPG